MLDSLVRVSRRVGWGADRLARDPETARESRPAAPQAVSEHCEQSTQVERATRSRGPYHGGCSSVRECVRLRPAPKRNYPRRGRSYLGQTVYRHPRTGPGTCPQEKAPTDDGRRGGPSTRIGRPTPPPSDRLNSKGRLAVPSVYL